MSKSRVFVLDTNVLLYNSSSFKSFGSKEVVIPYVVLEELDKFKSRDDEIGSNARHVARELYKLREEAHLGDGVVVTKKGGVLKVELNFSEPVSPLAEIKSADDRILNTCLGLKRKGKDIVLVTKDINLAVRADVFGVTAQDYDTDKLVASADDIHRGTAELVVCDSILDGFYNGCSVCLDDLNITKKFCPNDYLTLVSEEHSNKTALVRFVDKEAPLEKVRKFDSLWGLTPRNREQRFAADALTNKDIKLVTLTGKAGSGKTIISLACALHQVHDVPVYDRIVVSRPVQPMGKDIGYLPGDVLEKLSPWMGPIKDSLDYLTRGKDKKRNMYDEMVDMGMLEVQPLTYIRGRSMPNTIFILDEAEDTTRAEVKTIVSRMGENSKIVLIGDVMQITNPYVDATNNGLATAIEKFKPYDLAAHIHLEKGERSKLATLAAEIL
jgi:PhoH-like ATPase